MTKRSVQKLKNIPREALYLTVAAFFGLLSYPFTRTSAAPYFNEAFGAGHLTYAMIAAAILAIIAVIIYNRLAKKIALLKLCIGAMVFIILVTAGFGFIMGRHPKWMALLYYAWSDVYIVILVEQFWSISNTIFDKKTAKKYYGLFLFSGALGSLIGNALVAKLAEPLGADNLIFFCSFFLAIFVSILFFFNKSIGRSKEGRKKFTIEREIAGCSSFGGASLVFKSRYLTLIALLIVATQISINGSYFILNRMLDMISKEVASQSALYGRTFVILEALTLFTNAALVPLALKFLDVRKTHYSIIGGVFIFFCAAIISPQISFVALLFIVSKSFDYSIFRAAKEMLYLPLLIAEKFQAKAFIDVFVYRFAKAVAALSIIFVEGVLKLSPFYLVGFGLAAWLVLIYFILRRYDSLDGLTG